MLRTAAVALLAVLVVLIGACREQAPESADLAITHATIVNVTDGTVQTERTIFVQGNRILAILASDGVSIPDGATVVDATGQYVIPGLWDAHVHSATSSAWHFPLLVAHGVTGIRNMHSTVDTALALTNALKTQLASGQLLGPRMLANGPIIDGSPPAWPGSVVATTPDEGRAAVDSLVDAGADFIKVYDALALETFLAIADQARTRGIPLDGHMPMLVPPIDGAAAGMRTVEHLGGIAMGCSAKADSLRLAYTSLREQAPTMPFPDNMLAFFALGRRASDTRDPAACAETVDAYRAAGVAVTPTFTMFTSGDQSQLVLGDSARMQLVPAAVAAEWEDMASSSLTDFIATLMAPVAKTSVENLRLLHDAGVVILAGTDLGNPFLVPGASLHDELTLLVEAGLSPLEALQTATRNPARVFGTADSLGRVDVDMIADLVILRANPLDDIRNIRSVEGVVLNGVPLDRARLTRLVDSALTPAP